MLERPNLDIKVETLRPEFALETVKMWRQSCQRAMAIEEHNRQAALGGQLKYFRGFDPRQSSVLIDPQSSRFVGLLTLSDGEIVNSFLHVGYKRLGFGYRLLIEAKSQSPTGSTLFALLLRANARNFYRSQGFVEVARVFSLTSLA